MRGWDWDKWFSAVSSGERSVPIALVAEAGINHNGQLDTALSLVRQASLSGAHAIKFQKREPDVCIPEHQKGELRDTPWGRMTYLEYKHRIEFELSDYEQINAEAARADITWFASAWDIDSQTFLRNFSLPVNKIASAMLTHEELVTAVARERKPTFLSTGMSTMNHIDAAVEIFESAGCPFILMHSVSTYPAKEEDLNLSMIRTLRERYNRPVGYSGHESSLSPSIVAASMGAVAIERHFTLDRASWGTDQAASLEPDGLRSLGNILAKIPAMQGDGVKTFSPGEIDVARKLRYWQ